jgi:thiol-disulfide isomerase/thioredoxin
MLAFLAGGLALVGALAVLNLALTFAVIRRLRQHTELISTSRMPGPPDLMLGVGESPDRFSAIATDGAVVSREALVDGQLVGFFSPGCEPCRDMAPRFAEQAGRLPYGRSQALVVLVGAADEVGEFVALFEPVARVVVEDSVAAGDLAAAFKVKGVPAMCTLNADGAVATSGFGVVELPVPSLAT